MMTAFIIGLIISGLFSGAYYVADQVNRRVNEEGVSVKIMRALGQSSDPELDTFVIYATLIGIPALTPFLWKGFIVIALMALAAIGATMLLNFVVDLISIAIEEKKEKE